MDLGKKRLFLLDLDGTVYLEETLLPGAAAFFRWAADRGAQVRYLTNNSSRGVEAGLEKMHRLGVPARREEFLTADQAAAVRADQVLAFFTSDLGRWLLDQPEVHREFKFSLLADAQALGYEVPGEQVMLQGVVDCFAVEPDGLTILDFKTDRVSDAGLEDRAARYAPQIQSYGHALSRIWGLPVKRLILYFFAAGQAVDVPPQP